MQENNLFIYYKELVQKLFDILEVEVEELTKKEKELIIAYSYGMLSVIAEENKASGEAIYFIVKKTITEIFKYSEKETENVLNKLEDSIEKEKNEEIRIMIHQGKFVYPKYKEQNYNEIYDRLTNMIDVIVSGEYKNY